MSRRNQDYLTFNDQYNLYYWTEYYGTTTDNEFVGTKQVKQTELVRDNLGNFTNSLVPNNNKIRIGSKVLGFLDGEQNLTTEQFDESIQPYRVFRLEEYFSILERFRYKNPQRFLLLQNKNAYSSDGVSIGSPLILDSLVPKPPDYILEMSGKLTSQWSYDKLYGSKDFRKSPFIVGSNSLTTSFKDFQIEPFKLWTPFSYNFVDAFVNKMWTDVIPSGSYPILSASIEKFTKFYLWFENENADELPVGNHLGRILLPYTNSISWIPTGSVDSVMTTPYTLNTTTRGPIHIGLGRFSASITNVQSSYYTAANGAQTYSIDMFRNPNTDYFGNRGQLSNSNFIFNSTGSQPNLCNEWLWVYPNEHRFKNLIRQNSPKRIGNDTWGKYENSKYSTFGWEIPENLTDKDVLGNINDKKLGTLFWKFDSGHMINKYFGQPIVEFNQILGLVSSNTQTSSFRYYGYRPEIYLEPGTVLSPTIVLADFFGTPKGMFYPGFVEATSTSTSSFTGNFTCNFQLYPKLRDMYTQTNRLMQLSLSYTQTYPKISDIYKSFYGFGDGVVTRLSEYNVISSAYVSEDSDNFVGATLAHRRRVIWGRDKIPSFKFGYQFLHTMTYSDVPVPIEENEVVFTVSGSDVHYPIEPETWVLTGSVLSRNVYPHWPSDSVLTSGPNWHEGPYVVAGPILRGFKYGLYDALPKVANSVYRRDRFGNFRDMLEQRKFHAIKLSDTGTELFVVTTQFVTGSEDETNWLNYNNWQPGDAAPINNSDSGLYELHNRTGRPYNDSGWT